MRRSSRPLAPDRSIQEASLLAYLDHTRGWDRTRGRAGWPLHVFLTPAGHPRFGTVYQRRDDLLDLLRRLQERWQEDAKGLSALAEAGARELAGPTALPPALRPGEAARPPEHLRRALEAAGRDYPALTESPLQNASRILSLREKGSQ